MTTCTRILLDLSRRVLRQSLYTMREPMTRRWRRGRLLLKKILRWERRRATRHDTVSCWHPLSTGVCGPNSEMDPMTFRLAILIIASCLVTKRRLVDISLQDLLRWRCLHLNLRLEFVFRLCYAFAFFDFYLFCVIAWNVVLRTGALLVTKWNTGQNERIRKKRRMWISVILFLFVNIIISWSYRLYNSWAFILSIEIWLLS